MFYVYVLKSKKDNKLYFGQTNDPERRVKQHNSGQVRSTRYRRPLVLVGYKAFNKRNEARWCEYQIKNHSDKKNKFLKELASQKNRGSKNRRLK